MIRNIENADNFPSVDSVPVIRCRDCIHGRPKHQDMYECVHDEDIDESTGVATGFVDFHEPDFFCAYGEKKEQEGVDRANENNNETMNQEQVYAIVSGEHDDYVIHGYCTTLELAEKAAAVLNDKQPWADTFEIEPLKCLDEEGQNVEKIWYVYSVLFKKTAWKCDLIQVEYRTSTQHKAPRVVDARGWFEPDSRGVNVFVCLEKEDTAEAKRVAKTYLRAWLKEKGED